MNEPSYRFLNYKMFTSSMRLTQNGVELTIRPKTMSTLIYLIKHENRVVSKEEMLDVIWPDSEVQDQAVFQSISELRSIFKGHNCIETIRGSGYRWRIPTDAPEHEIESNKRRWRILIAACLVGVAGSIAFWQTLNETRSFTVLVQPSVHSGGSLFSSGEHSTSIDKMLVQQLRRFGWESQQPFGSARHADQLEITVQRLPVGEGTLVRYTLKNDSVEVSGNIASATPLGAIRDLAVELRDSLSVMVDDQSTEISASTLFARAKLHLDKEEYSLAEANLRVALDELPNQMSLQRALAYTYQQLGQTDDALFIASDIYTAATKKNERADRMMSSLMLSKLHFAKGNFIESKKFAVEALDIATNLNDLLIFGEAQEQLGELSLVQGDVANGKVQLTAALEYFNTFCPTGKTRVEKRLRELES